MPSLFSVRLSSCRDPPPEIEAEVFYTAIRADTAKYAAVYLSARLYAAQLELIHNQSPSRRCLPLKLAAIKTLRDVLSESRKISDEDILAVIFMSMSFNKVRVAPLIF